MMIKKILAIRDNKYKLIYLIPIGLFSLGMMILIGVYAISFLLGPPKLTNDQNTIYYSSSSEMIGEERGVENRYWVNLDNMSPHLIDATLAIEDQYFYEHNGFDLKRIAGALLTDIKNFSLEEGASTLTQQYARNLFLTHDKTWTRKLKEAFYTVRLEMYYSKSELLEGYLNTVYYGHGAYGVEAASKFFYDKPADDLNLAEASMLAGIPKGPSYYSPFNNQENAENRQQTILNQMLANDHITQEAHSLASSKDLALTKPQERERVSIAPHFQDTVLNEARDILQIDAEKIRSGGYQIYTTLDIDQQKALEKNAKDAMDSDSDIEVGAMAMDPETGGIRALLGGRDYNDSQYNRAVQASRMPGSAFKPFLYYAALNNGYNPTTELMSKPTAFKLADGEVYKPSNYNGYYAYEPIPLAQALALSDNIYAVKTNLYLDEGTLVETAKDFGIDGNLPDVPSLALGTASVTIKDMVTGYSMLANGGKQIEGHTISRIVDREGNTVFERANPAGEQVLDPQTTFILTHLMTGMFDRSLDGYMAVTGSRIADQLSHNYAGKSGTTTSDSWMIGYSPSLVTGVWNGYDNSKEITKTRESRYAKDIWADFMEDAHKDTGNEHFAIPSGVSGVPVDPESGKRATPYCDTSRLIYFEKGDAPQEHCTLHMPEDGQPEENDNQQEDNSKGLLEKIFDGLF